MFINDIFPLVSHSDLTKRGFSYSYSYTNTSIECCYNVYPGIIIYTPYERLLI